MAPSPAALECWYLIGWGEEIHVHVATTAEHRLKFLEDQEDFPIIVAGFAFGFDVDGTDLTAVLASVQVVTGHQMRVIETEASGAWFERDPAHVVRRDVRRAFLGGAVNFDREELPMPVQLLGRVCVVVDVNGNGLVFFQSQ